MSSDYRTGSIRALAISGKCRRYMYLSGKKLCGAARTRHWPQSNCPLTHRPIAVEHAA